MKIKPFIITIILLAITMQVTADVRFYSINAIHGISMREAAGVCSDDNGFIWASSRTGILRLTKDDYRTYQLPYEHLDILSTKIIYKNSILLAYTNNGQVFRYNTLLDRFDLFIDLRKNTDNIHLRTSSVFIDDNSDVWIASSHGLFYFQSGELTKIESVIGQVFDVVQYDNRRLLISSGNQILFVDVNTKEFESIYKDDVQSVFIGTKLFYEKSSKKLWMGTRSNGLFLYDLGSNKLSKIQSKTLPKQPILALATNSDSTILVGIDGQGIWELTKDGSRILNIYKENADDPLSLKGNGVYDIFCDQNRRVWICTHSGGVSFYDQESPIVNHITHQINNPNSLGNNYINQVMEDSRGVIWFATNNGISSWDVKSDKWATYYHNKQEQAQVFRSICEDNQGRIWAGTFSTGVYVIDGKTGKELARYVENEQDSIHANNYVFDITKDKEGDLWMCGPMGNVIRHIDKTGEYQSYPAIPAYTFAELSSDEFLLACTYGLCLLDKKTAKSERLLTGYLLHDLLVVGEDVWLCSCGEGLIRFNLKDKTLEKFTVESGLPSNYVNSIMLVDGYFWLGTENGLCRFNPEDKSVVNYSSAMSLRNVSFNLNSCCKLKNGQLIWGTNNGAVLFYPASIQQIHSTGDIFFQDISVSGRSIRDSSIYNLTVPINDLQEIKLKYYQNNLGIELFPINVTTPGSKFSWKMEGLDKDWTKPSGQKILTYANIPNGNFRLKIRLYDSSLSNILAERDINISITPPFWKTWWFRFMVVFILCGVAYFSLRFYINQLKQRHAEEKIRFFTNTAHDIRTSLTLIKGPVEELKKESNLSDLGHRYLQLAIEQSRRLSNVVTQLMDFQKVDVGKGQLALKMVDIVQLVSARKFVFESYAKSNSIELSFSADNSAYQTAIDELKIEKVIDNLISNAIKYSKSDGRVDIVLKCNPDNWELEVIDQGIGISIKDQHKLFKEFYRSENAVNSKTIGSGIGLLLVKHYIEMHGGDISFVSQENVGSTFKMSIPFNEVSEVEEFIRPVRISEAFTSLSNTEVSLLPQKIDDNQSESEMSILVVDDNPDLRSFVGTALSGEFNVFTANDGAQGWEIVQQQQPDLIVSDVMMPNMDGFEFCERLKSTYETSHIPIILLTSLSERTQQLHGLGLGADDYLTKPFDMTLLLQRIKSIIKNREIIREKALVSVKEDENKPILENDLNDKFVKKALEVVHQNMANSEFGKDEFASAMHVSSSLLYKKIKALTDQSPVDFIKSIRLNHALELLQTKKYTITEVSELCGFSSVGYFSTTFKKRYGKSPSEMVE